MNNRAWLALAASLVSAVVIKELRKPAGERTWVGRLGGIVPYDLRPPTLRRVRSTFWAPDNPKVLVPQAFGVGWTVNLGRLLRLVLRD